MIPTPSARRRIGARIALVAVAAAALLSPVGPTPAAEAQPAPTLTTTTQTTTTTIGHCCVSAGFSPTSGLTDGSVVDVTLHASGNGFLRDPTPIQICKTETGPCPEAQPPSPAADATINFRPPGTPGPHVVPFRIGTGVFRTTTSSGSPYTFVCGPGEPCFLRVSFGPQYGTVPITRSAQLTYAGTPVTTTSTTSTTTTTTTTAPTHPLCAYRDNLPAWLWAVLASVLGISC